MWVEILKTGSYKEDFSNNPRIITRETLDEWVREYSPKTGKVPVCIGPIKDDSPVWAWVEELKREGNVLFGNLQNVVPEFAKMLQARAFSKRAVTFTGWGAVGKISFLGAEPPELKDAGKGFDFYSGPGTTCEFTEKDLFTGNPSDQLSILVCRKQVEKPDLSYSAAFTEVQKENPELTWEYVEELYNHHNKKGGRK
jgi:hypothetical protein